MDGVLNIHFDGNSGGVPHLVSQRMGSNGKPYSLASVRLAVNNTQGGKEKVTWIKLVVFGVGRAEKFAEIVKKGYRISGNGNWVELQTWSKSDGSVATDIAINVTSWMATPPGTATAQAPTVAAPVAAPAPAAMPISGALEEAKKRMAEIDQLLAKAKAGQPIFVVEDDPGNPFVEYLQ